MLTKPEAPARSTSTRRLMIVLFLGVLMGAMDIAILGPALPAMAANFGVSERNLALLFSIYVLFNLAGTPVMAKLADSFGRRPIYVLDVALFAAGSLGVALSPNFALLLAARALQGLGAGGIFPVASAVIGDVFPPERRGRALGLIGMVFGLAFIVGPILAGVLLPFGWRWLFWINLPLALLVIGLGLGSLPRGGKRSDGAFDGAGATLLSLALGAFAFGLSRIDTGEALQSLFRWQSGGLLILALLALAAFIAREGVAKSPIIDLRLFKNPDIARVGVLNVLAGMVESGLVFLPLYAVFAFGASESGASFLLLPLVLGLAVASPLAGRALDRFGPRPVLVFGSSAMSLGLLALGFAGPLGLAGFIGAGSLVGFGLASLLGAPIRYVLLHEAPPEQRSVAQGLVAVQGGAGQLVAAAALGGLIASIHDKALAYAVGFRVLGLVASLSIPFALAMRGRKGESR